MKQEARLKKWDELIRQKRYPGIQNFCALLGVEGAVSDRTLEADIRELKKIHLFRSFSAFKIQQKPWRLLLP
jgi:hypothetical protein